MHYYILLCNKYFKFSFLQVFTCFYGNSQQIKRTKNILDVFIDEITCSRQRWQSNEKCFEFLVDTWFWVHFRAFKMKIRYAPGLINGNWVFVQKNWKISYVWTKCVQGLVLKAPSGAQPSCWSDGYAQTGSFCPSTIFFRNPPKLFEIHSNPIFDWKFERNFLSKCHLWFEIHVGINK